MNTLKIVLIAIVASLAAWLGLNLITKSDILGRASDLKKSDPTLTNDEANAKAAAEISQESLNKIYGVEENLNTAESAARAKAAEEAAARAEAEALIAQNPAAKAAAEEAARQAEAQASKARAELEASWTSALDTAVSEMNKAKSAAEVALQSVSSAQNNVVYWQGRIDWARLGVVNANYQFQVATNDTVKARMKADMDNYLTYLKNYQEKLQSAQIVFNSVRISAVSAVQNTNNAVNFVLSLVRDLQSFGILSALANRVSSQAEAVRNALSLLEAKIPAPVAVGYGDYYY